MSRYGPPQNDANLPRCKSPSIVQGHAPRSQRVRGTWAPYGYSRNPHGASCKSCAGADPVVPV